MKGNIICFSSASQVSRVAETKNKAKILRVFFIAAGFSEREGTNYTGSYKWLSLFGLIPNSP